MSLADLVSLGYINAVFCSFLSFIMSEIMLSASASQDNGSPRPLRTLISLDFQYHPLSP